MKEAFVDINFAAKSLELIATCNDIIKRYAAQGYDLSLRQLYYQLVSANIVANNEKNYDRVGTVISDARLAGLIDWDAIVDRGRECVVNGHWTSPAGILRSAARSFNMDLWIDQPNYVEVMVEKQALEGVLLPICRELDVPFTSNKGYSSSSAMYCAGLRLREQSHRDRIVIIYLGDHDPSGLDMSRDVGDRLRMFSRNDDVEVDRVALNMDQIRRLRPPPNPAKMTDKRAAAYVAEHGHQSWELDAIEPRMLAQIVRDAVVELRDDSLFDAILERRRAFRERLEQMATDFDDAEGEDDDEG